MDDGTIFMLLEFAEGGSLDRWIWNSPMGGLPWTNRMVFLYDTAEALEFLHMKHRVLHRDVKSPNVLILLDDTKRWRAKLTDFGISKILSKEALNTFPSQLSLQVQQSTIKYPDNLCGTPRWMAPESMTGKTCECASIDVYSFGIVMWEVLTGSKSWNMNISVDDLFDRVCEFEGAKQRFNSLPLSFLSLIRRNTFFFFLFPYT